MRDFMVSALAIGLAASFIGCATDEAEPDEGSVSSAVTEHAANYVKACGGLALRWWDAPNADIKEILPLGFIVHVGEVHWATGMANITATPAHPKSGWMKTNGANGPLLSVDPNGCN